MQTEEKFSLGQIVSTPNALAQVSQEEITLAITRHQSGDWGDVEEPEMNDEAVKVGRGQIMSVYKTINGTKFWIITEHNRSVTTVLMPEDY